MEINEKKEAVIEVFGLTKSFGSLTAVNNVSFEVNRGEIFGFLGPNGAGKTSTIRMLAGLSKPTSGDARVLGYDVRKDKTTIKKRIGVVPELSNLYDELSAFDNLMFMAGLYGVPARERKARCEALLRLFGLYERKDDHFDTFSRGMKRSLTIAAALIHNPEILFLDEPTIGLDVMHARMLRCHIASLKERGITVFLTTHYLKEADILCDRIAIIVGGRILLIDTPGNIKKMAEEVPSIEFAFRENVSALAMGMRGIAGGARAVQVDDHRIRVYGGSPSCICGEVSTMAAAHGLEMVSVNTMKPSLEDAFIYVTGHDMCPDDNGNGGD